MLIDATKNYVIKGRPSSLHKELGDRGLSLYPGTSFSVTPIYDEKIKKYVTGLDEYSREIEGITDINKRDEERKRVIEVREDLERKMGIPGTLSATSQDWETRAVLLEVGQDLKIRVNGKTGELSPSTNYNDYLTCLMIFNSPDFPKSKEEASEPRFRDAPFYITTTEDVTGEYKGKLQRNKRMFSELSNLFPVDSKKTNGHKKAKEISKYLGLVGLERISIEELEIKLTEALTNDKKGDFVTKFLDACEMPEQNLLVYNLFKSGIDNRVISLTPSGYYHRGVTNYRDTIKDSVAFLLIPDNAVELAQLKEDVVNAEKRKSFV